MSQNEAVVEEISRLYVWLDEILGAQPQIVGPCTACGKCCDFDAYGHRLYVTHAEMLYFSEKIGRKNLKAMHSGQCPYLEDNRCSVHEHRFSGCRIYGCQGESDLQNQVTEQTLDKIKALCDTIDIPYEYQDLRQALNQSVSV
ncbi:MAG: YkgJ family cysteine cluster protein [Phycisphaerae bacterium]|nr:YkgJ family cysteine cluster protein [Phycisphaerae bacterium]